MYRGSHAEAVSAASRVGQAPNFLRNNLPVYFSNTKNSVRSYGTAVKYVTTRDLNLLNMGNVNEVARLIESAKSPVVKKSLEKAFRISNGIVRRSSKIKYDIHVAVFICRRGYDGYYAPRLPNKYGGGGTFHPEIVLCHPRAVLKVYNVKPALDPPPLNPKRSVNNLRNVVRRTNYSSA